MDPIAAEDSNAPGAASDELIEGDNETIERQAQKATGDYQNTFQIAPFTDFVSCRCKSGCDNGAGQ